MPKASDNSTGPRGFGIRYPEVRPDDPDLEKVHRLEVTAHTDYHTKKVFFEVRQWQIRKGKIVLVLVAEQASEQPFNRKGGEAHLYSRARSS